MTIQFRNRLTGSLVETLPKNPLLGQWQVIGSEKVFLNTFPVDSGQYLVPDSTHRWSLHSESNQWYQEGSFPQWQLPSDLVFESIRFFENQHQNLLSTEADWADWVGISPLVPEMDKRIEIQPLEKAIRQRLAHLKEVCHRPRTYLKVEIERLPVSRARRIPPAATNFLASHTEDWERRTLRSVLPKRILGVVAEDLWDIYENRVAKQLLDNLLKYLKRRIQELKKLKDIYKKAANFSEKAHGIHWRNARRICTLWGEQFDADERVKKASETLHELEQLRHKLQGLIDTVLYQSIPPRADVGTSLKMTNILVNDQHYRHVGLLWKEWRRWGSGQNKNSLQVFQENQELCRGFEAFCLLVIGRALEGFNLNLDGNEIPKPGGAALQFQGLMGKVFLQWQKDGSFSLHMGEKAKKLHFIPLLAALTANPDSKAADVLLQSLSDRQTPEEAERVAGKQRRATSCSNSSEPQLFTVILYPGTDEERKKLPAYIQRRMNTLGNDHLPGEPVVALLPIS